MPLLTLSTAELIVDTTAEMIAFISSLVIVIMCVILFYYPTIGLQPQLYQNIQAIQFRNHLL